MILAYLEDSWDFKSGVKHSYLGITYDSDEFEENPDKLKLRVLVESLAAVGRWMIIMSNLVPISLLVTVESVRFLQAYFIMWDVDLCSARTGI